jgi:hypothetical protein
MERAGTPTTVLESGRVLARVARPQTYMAST